MQFVPLILTAAAGGVSAVQQRRQGQIADVQYRQQAQAEQDASRDREIERRRSLVSALASQNAEAAALGISTNVGSRAAITMTDVKRADMDRLVDRASTNRRVLMLRQSGNEARRQGNIGAVATLLDTAGQVADAWPGKTKPKVKK